MKKIMFLALLTLVHTKSNACDLTELCEQIKKPEFSQLSPRLKYQLGNTLEQLEFNDEAIKVFQTITNDEMAKLRVIALQVKKELIDFKNPQEENNNTSSVKYDDRLKNFQEYEKELAQICQKTNTNSNNKLQKILKYSKI